LRACGSQVKLRTIYNIAQNFLIVKRILQNPVLLDKYTKQNNWKTVEVKIPFPMSNKSKTPHGKLDVLTANYPIQKDI
jgi:hypothetical protein